MYWGVGLRPEKYRVLCFLLVVLECLVTFTDVGCRGLVVNLASVVDQLRVFFERCRIPGISLALSPPLTCVKDEES